MDPSHLARTAIEDGPIVGTIVIAGLSAGSEATSEPNL